MANKPWDDRKNNPEFLLQPAPSYHSFVAKKRGRMANLTTLATPEVRVLPECSLYSEPVEKALSLRLKMETADLHRAAEQALGLPRRIVTLRDYAFCLRNFYLLYCPLEASMVHFEQWASLGLDMRERALVPSLRKDLLALGMEDADLTPFAWFVPTMPGFAYALGARYVLEGSTLGAQHILRYVHAVLGTEIEGADAFFRGHGLRTGSMWHEFRTALDTYGAQFPESANEVLAGASETFQAMAKGLRS